MVKEKVLEFVPGYYEWLLYDGDDLIYVWDDFIEDLPEHITSEPCYDEADLLMEQLRQDFDERGKEIDEALVGAATEIIANEIQRRFG